MAHSRASLVLGCLCPRNTGPNVTITAAPQSEPFLPFLVWTPPSCLGVISDKHLVNVCACIVSL